ncbi:hypothetical protein GF359_00655 [candidate division WOR-3 bacterium]|uniref:ADP-ribosylglycohydrolase family protein n=1 Tax=candidate division WOR-3 bacterium TaxID=2052148 RepID=A0A9D5QBK6_UNCW3|nr:hypothetical protein [candidate division WOR-3 bacterium]MBD3363703.1 hypothetical protein [candidate division WOR-3 bacterium]
MSGGRRLKVNLRDKVAGVVFGTAIGDALGYPVEFMSMPEIESLGRVKDYLCCEKIDGTLAAPYSDDTQMFRAVLEGLLKAGRSADLEQAALTVAGEFIKWSKSPENNRSPGNACMAGCRNLASGKYWRESGKPESGGCGSAMRSMAYGIWFWNEPKKAALWAGEHTLVTHGHPMARAGAAAVAAGTAYAVKDSEIDGLVRIMINAAKDYDASTSQMLEDSYTYAKDESVQAKDVLDKWRGWRGDEAVAASLFCVLRHPDDFEKAVLEAVNSPGDSDSLGAITGAMLGARVGIKGIRKDWIERIEKTNQLKELAERAFTTIEEKNIGGLQ